MNEKETKAKRILLIAGIAGAACLVCFLGISHQKGKAEGNGRRHFLSWNKEGDFLSTEPESEYFIQAETPSVAKKMYLGMEGLREQLGETKYQAFKLKFESYLSGSGAPDCETVTLASPQITADETGISCYLQTDDKDNSLYQFIYRMADDSYSFVAVDELPPMETPASQEGTDPEAGSLTGQDNTQETETGDRTFAPDISGLARQSESRICEL